MDKEMALKMCQANSVEEVLAVAKEFGMELTEEKAKEVYDNVCAQKASGSESGELSDDDLSDVAGGFSIDPVKALSLLAKLLL